MPKNSSIQSDQVIRLVGPVAEKKCRDLLRRVVVWDEANQRRIVLLSNHLEFGATTIAAIYQDRWEIELFFKTLKQHLKVRTFVGTSENALRIQIWTALIALLLLKWLHYQSHLFWSFSNLATMLRLNLFTYRDLLEWLKGTLRAAVGAGGRLRSPATASFAARIWTASELIMGQRADRVLKNRL